jgi:hypothetical protein
MGERKLGVRSEELRVVRYNWFPVSGWERISVLLCL